MRDSLNKSVLSRVNQKSPLRPHIGGVKRKHVPLYQKIEMRYVAKKEEEERYRIQKLRDPMRYEYCSGIDKFIENTSHAQ